MIRFFQLLFSIEFVQNWIEHICSSANEHWSRAEECALENGTANRAEDNDHHHNNRVIKSK